MKTDTSFSLDFDDETTRKIIGMWDLAKHITGLQFRIVGEKMRVLWIKGSITEIPLNIFMSLAGAEIVEIIEREKEKRYGKRG